MCVCLCVCVRVCGLHHESHASLLVAPPPSCPSNQVRKVQYLSADEYKCVCFYQRRGPCGTGGATASSHNARRGRGTGGQVGRGGGGARWLQSVTVANRIRVCFSAASDSRLMWFLQLPKDQLIRSNSQPSKRERQRSGGWGRGRRRGGDRKWSRCLHLFWLVWILQRLTDGLKQMFLISWLQVTRNLCACVWVHARVCARERASVCQTHNMTHY